MTASEKRLRLAAVIGLPVVHSRSPAIHNAAFAALGLGWTYLAFDVPTGRVPQAVRGMRALVGFDGMSVTYPHKLAVAKEVDQLSPDSLALGVVNTVVRDPDGRLRGDSTDGPGFVASLAASDFDPGGKRCLIIGAGGSARAIVRSLARAGAAEVAVLNRTRENAIKACSFGGAVGRIGAPEDAARADLVVNATPLGMTSPVRVPTTAEGEAAHERAADENANRLPLAADLLGPHQLVVDLVYDPPITPFMVAATTAGAKAVNGLGLLVAQAALQFTLWTGEPAPLEVMRAAAGGG